MGEWKQKSEAGTVHRRQITPWHHSRRSVNNKSLYVEHLFLLQRAKEDNKSLDNTELTRLIQQEAA